MSEMVKKIYKDFWLTKYYRSVSKRINLGS